MRADVSGGGTLPLLAAAGVTRAIAEIAAI
jgi:hypothetical protein